MLKIMPKNQKQNRPQNSPRHNKAAENTLEQLLFSGLLDLLNGSKLRGILMLIILDIKTSLNTEDAPKEMGHNMHRKLHTAAPAEKRSKTAQPFV